MPERIEDEEAASAAHNTEEEFDLDHFCAPIFHPTTGETISKYKTLEKDPEILELWTTAFVKNGVT